jgi:hypothetical protein
MNDPRFASLGRKLVFMTISIPISSGDASRLSALIVAGTQIAPTGESVTITAADVLSCRLAASDTLGIQYGGKADSTPLSIPAGDVLADDRLPAAYWPNRTWVRSSGAAFTAQVMVILK